MVAIEKVLQLSCTRHLPCSIRKRAFHWKQRGGLSEKCPFFSPSVLLFACVPETRLLPSNILQLFLLPICCHKISVWQKFAPPAVYSKAHARNSLCSRLFSARRPILIRHSAANTSFSSVKWRIKFLMCIFFWLVQVGISSYCLRRQPAIGSAAAVPV